MLPENVKWDAVFQSIVDTWLPLIGVVAAIVVIAIIVHVVRKKENKDILPHDGKRKKAVVKQTHFHAPMKRRL